MATSQTAKTGQGSYREKNRSFQRKNTIRWALQGYAGREDRQDAGTAIGRLVETASERE